MVEVEMEDVIEGLISTKHVILMPVLNKCLWGREFGENEG